MEIFYNLCTFSYTEEYPEIVQSSSQDENFNVGNGVHKETNPYVDSDEPKSIKNGDTHEDDSAMGRRRNFLGFFRFQV